MKVSGAVAMADDPGHAFGIYFEKIADNLEFGVVAGAPGCEARTEKSVSARSPSAMPADAYVYDFDADGNPIWRQVKFYRDGKWVKPIAFGDDPFGADAP